MSVSPVSGPVYLFSDIAKCKEIKSYEVKNLVGGSDISPEQFDIIKASLNYRRDRLFDVPSDGYYENNIVYWKTKNMSLTSQENSEVKSSLKSLVQQMTELEDETASTTTSHGTHITFMSGLNTSNHEKMNSVKIERMDGLNVVIDLKRNAMINEGSDGSLSIYYPETQEMQILDKDGNFHSSILDGENSKGMDGDDIFINIQGGKVDVGNGNHIVINACDNTSIYAGDGDNHIINVGRVTHNVNIVCGNGNNNLEMHGCYDGSITTGSGNNTLTGLLASTTVNMGAGNHVIWVNGCTADIEVGAGNTRVETTYYTGKIRSQRGGLLQITFPHSSERSQSLVSAEIKADGDLDINVGSLCGGVTVAGKTRMMVDSAYSGPLVLQTSDSNDDIYIGNGIGTINTGGGNDSVTVESWKGTVNGQIVPRFEGIIGSRLETAFRDPFFASYHSPNFSRQLWSAVNINR